MPQPLPAQKPGQTILSALERLATAQRAARDAAIQSAGDRGVPAQQAAPQPPAGV